MDHGDWISATGSWTAGRGQRPVNPRLLVGLTTKAMKAMPPAVVVPRATKGRAYRRLVASLAAASARCDAMMASPRTASRAGTVRDASISEQCRPGAAGGAARMRHTIAVERARKRF